MTQPLKIEQDGDQYRVDKKSQIILSHLKSAGGHAETGVLREAIGADQGQSIHYRWRNHLGPDALNLIQRKCRRTRKRGDDEWVYELTDRGKRFVEQHRDTLTNSVAVANALEQFELMEETIEEFENRVSEMEAEFGRIESEINNKQTQFTRWKQKTQDVRDDLDELITVVNEERVEGWRHRQLADDVDDLAHDLDCLGTDLDQVTDTALEIEERQQRIIASIDQLRTRIDRNEQEITRTQTAVDKLLKTIHEWRNQKRNVLAGTNHFIDLPNSVSDVILPD